MAPPKKSKNYFTQDTENAIVKYNNTPDFEEKNKIYHKEIHYAFFKLTENIIHTFKFYNTEVDNIEDLQHEVITFLLSKIHRFDPSRGSKAYSYFGTIAKRYLILSNQKIYKKKIDISHIDDIDQDENHSHIVDDDNSIELLSTYIDQFTGYCTENIFELFPKEQDARIADAVLELFRKREYIDVFNKKALYIFIREQIDVKTPKITKVVNELYSLFRNNYVFYIENGYIKFE
jgi:hypothetical protein